jgi:hypothetical protein
LLGDEPEALRPTIMILKKTMGHRRDGASSSLKIQNPVDPRIFQIKSSEVDKPMPRLRFGIRLSFFFFMPASENCDSEDFFRRNWIGTLAALLTFVQSNTHLLDP